MCLVSKSPLKVASILSKKLFVLIFFLCTITLSDFEAACKDSVNGQGDGEILMSRAVSPYITTITGNPGKPFYFGVYIYDYRLKVIAEEQAKSVEQVLDEQMIILREKGANAIYLTVSKPEYFEGYIQLSEQNGMKIIPQLEFVYFNENWTDDYMDKIAKIAGLFINKYSDCPQVLAWSVREEIKQEDVAKLSRYYSKIRNYAPGAKFNLVHNDIAAARDQIVPSPYIEGTDRYGFWWEFSGEGYLASPSFALKWTREGFSSFYLEAAKRGADFMAVVTQGGLALPSTAQKYAEATNVAEIAANKIALNEKITKFAKEGRMGWKKFMTPEGPRYNLWKYYRLPKNCMKALAWSSVMEGARLFFCWSFSPLSTSQLELNFEKAATAGDRNQVALWTLAGRPGKPNPQLDEFSDSSREIRKYEKIITSMTKIPNALMQCKEKDFFNRAFTFPGLKGKIFVLHNANVGIWPADSAYFFKDIDPIYIDDQGNLEGYEGLRDEMTVHCKILEGLEGSDLFDILSGEKLEQKDGLYVNSLMPGSGKLLYYGDREEAQKLHNML